MAMSSQVNIIPCVIFRKSNSIRSPPSITKFPPELILESSEKEYGLSLLGDESGTAATPTVAGHSRSEARSFSSATSKQSTPYNQKTNSKRRCMLLKDVSCGTFVDLFGQVVKTFSEGHRFLLYVTDYTHNKGLFNYAVPDDGDGSRDGDEFNYIGRARRKWPGPYGKMTIQITLWDPHAFFARQHVKEEDIIFLQNVNIKPDRHSGRIEGSIHTDRLYPDKLYIRVLDDSDSEDRVKELIKRKRQYWKKFNEEHPRSEDPANKRSVSDDEEQRSKVSKKKRNSRKQNEKISQPEINTVLPKREGLNSHSECSLPI